MFSRALENGERILKQSRSFSYNVDLMSDQMSPFRSRNKTLHQCTIMGSSGLKTSSIVHILVIFLLVHLRFVLFSRRNSGILLGGIKLSDQKKFKKWKIIRQRLKEINKPASPDGDIIDCVLLHHQPAFNHPQLKGQQYRIHRRDLGLMKLKDSDGGRREFGRKPRRRVRRDSTSNGQQAMRTQSTGTGGWNSDRGASRILAGMFVHSLEGSTMVQFGGEIVNSRAGGFHTSTAMGSGHFSGEGFRRPLISETYKWLIGIITYPITESKLLADHPNCYDIRVGLMEFGALLLLWRTGKNVRCP
ncbi:hypothetical protein F3Y22_tig00110206pilonHSYRG00016 [Hibiscus syriacus]|uniref:Neprosin activation peptide domain-containing protein n=1 Tax=Hibiscus syriacus TaxID=106335 RepID=A0A6A3BCQ6_HIBSY|nr:hypothetical protein F3Y22_tig00110206pilonHSYRG00016 [Hibiscus syriacus]